MAIRPVSDIVLDVARAADPTAYKAAAARLGDHAGAAPGPEMFGDMIDGMRPSPAAPRVPFDPASAIVRMRNSDALTARRADPYEKFEAFVLQTFIQSMLPKDSEALFGAGTAGEIWRSMLAESLGSQLAQTGGIGIAQMLAEADAARDSSDDVAEPPRTQTGS